MVAFYAELPIGPAFFSKARIRHMTSQQLYLSPDLATPLAAVDIGTNSIRLIIAEGQRDGKYRILDDEKDAARLGAKLGSTGRLDPAAVERSIEALRRMKSIIDGFQCGRTRVIATCAVREAQDGEEFRRRVKEEVGFEIEVISAKQEGRLAFKSVQRHFDLQAMDVLTADIGGGSTEMVAAAGNCVEGIYTTPLGAVRFAEKYHADQRLSRAGMEAMLAEMDAVLRDRVGRPPFTPHVLFGTGGTFTALASLVMSSKGQTGLPMRGYVVRRAEVRHALDRLGKTSLKLRRAMPGLSPERADIIVAGVAIVDRIMAHFEINRLQVHTGGVRDGLMLTMVEETTGGAALKGVVPQPDRQTALERFASECGVDMIHSRQVGRLAGRLFDALQQPCDMDPADRQLLEAAALLQDVGYLINYEDHHKHSLHLILNSDLPGFAPQDLQVLANVARYHRGAEPRKKHVQYEQLSVENQLRVQRLAAILRVAGGLDRSHSQQVQDVAAVASDHELSVGVYSPHEPEVDLWGARRRTAMFERVFARRIAFHWAGPQKAVAAG